MIELSLEDAQSHAIFSTLTDREQEFISDWRTSVRRIGQRAREAGFPQLAILLYNFVRADDPVLEHRDLNKSWTSVPLTYFRFTNPSGSQAPGIRMATTSEKMAGLPTTLQRFYSVVGGISEYKDCADWGILTPEGAQTAASFDFDFAVPGNDYWHDSLLDFDWLDPTTVNQTELYAFENIGTGDYRFADHDGRCIRYELSGHYFYDDGTTQDALSSILQGINDQWNS